MPYIKFVPSGIAAKPTIKFHGANVQIVNGTGLTESVNGRGNLVLGYDEHSSFNPQMSSHDLILGQNHSFTGYAQLIAGFQNTASGDYATVLGDTNAASGRYASVTGGQFNSAQHTASSVTGGELNNAYASYSSVTGGYANRATGAYDLVAGGCSNVAGPGTYLQSERRLCGDTTGQPNSFTSVTGGGGNHAVSTSSSITGGTANNASGFGATVSGGKVNAASSQGASVTGGEFNEATDPDSAILGGCKNLTGTGSNGWIAECDPADTVSGGVTNKAGGSGASVSGGISNNAVGFEASISGGELNTASGGVSSVSGGRGKRVHRCVGSILGGCSNVTGAGATTFTHCGVPDAPRYNTVSGGEKNTSGSDSTGVADSILGGLRQTLTGSTKTG